jgi:hypothetical protein
MAKSKGPNRMRRSDRRWWIGAAVGSVVLAAGSIVTAYVIADRGAPVSRRSPAKPPTAQQSTLPQSTAPQRSVPPTSGPCGDRRAVTAPAPSGRDDTASLKAFFAVVPNDSCVAFVRATYQVSGTLVISGKSGLDVRGNRAVLAAQTQADRNRRHVVIMKSSNMAISDLYVRGANQQHLRSQWQLEAQHGFEIADHSIGIRLVNVRVDEVYGDAIYIGGDSNDVAVQGGSFNYTGRQGIAVTAASRVTLEGFTLRNAGRYCIDLEPNVPRIAVDQVTIRNTNAVCPRGWLIVHSGTVRNVFTTNNLYNGRPMQEGRLVPGVYPK